MNYTHISPSSHRDATVRERRRIQAAKLFQKGRSQAEVARYFGVSREAVRKWHDTWKRKGVDGLFSRPHPGRPSTLTALKQQRVARALLKGPHAFGYATEIWTLARIAKVIYQVAAVRYHSGHVWRVLHTLGWSSAKNLRPASKSAMNRQSRSGWRSNGRTSKKGAQNPHQYRVS